MTCFVCIKLYVSLLDFLQSRFYNMVVNKKRRCCWNMIDNRMTGHDIDELIFGTNDQVIVSER